jgi:hypothetical protein
LAGELQITETDPINLLRPLQAEKIKAHLTGNKQDEIFIEPHQQVKG